MAQKKESKKDVTVRDLAPKKDAKGGRKPVFSSAQGGGASLSGRGSSLAGGGAAANRGPVSAEGGQGAN